MSNSCKGDSIADHDERAARQRQEAFRERHIGRLLLRAHRAFSARASERLRQRGYSGLSLAHIALLPHLDGTGTHISVLAERAGMTKQGMGQLVADLERQGFLQREPDPVDRRATLVRFTDQGARLLEDAVGVTGQMEAEYTALLGADRLVELKNALSEIAGDNSLPPERSPATQ